jgi:effector-binding domain-containing protein
MKLPKPFFVFLLFVIISGFILSLLLPASQKLEKSITINAPAPAVYDQLSKLENFNNWSVWGKQDSSAKYSITGTDGTVGAASSWRGNPDISGEGKLEITALEPGRQITHSLHLAQPRKANGKSVFTLSENNGLTTVTWNFEMATPRPWNIFNLFYSMEKLMGHDFEKGLIALKEITEKKTGVAPVKTYKVMMMDFPATRFAMIRQQVKWADITSFYQQHLSIISNEARKNNINAGPATGLYFVWDEKNQQTDMAAAVPVPTASRLETGSIVRIQDIGASKAVYVNYSGSYDNIAEAHTSLDKYLAEKSLTQKAPVIEQYISGPANEKDTAKWLTRIVYLVE